MTVNGDWLAAVALSKCGRAACAVAAAIYARMNHQAGFAEPSVATIANDTLMSERSVQVGIRELEEERLLEVQRPDVNGRGRASKYRPVMVRKVQEKAMPIAYVKVQEVAPIQERKVQNQVKIGAESCAERVQNPAPQLQEDNFSKELLSDTTASQDIFAATPDEVAKAMTHPTPGPVAPVVSWLDWRRDHPRIGIGRTGEDGDMAAWHDLWNRYGIECFDCMYKILTRTLDPSKRIWYSQAAQWMVDNTMMVDQ